MPTQPIADGAITMDSIRDFNGRLIDEVTESINRELRSVMVNITVNAHNAQKALREGRHFDCYDLLHSIAQNGRIQH